MYYLLNDWSTYCKLINLSCQYTDVKFKIFCIYTLYCGFRCGYPDPTYLDRVLEELEDKGVTEESADDPEEYKEYTKNIQKKLNTCRVNWSWVERLMLLTPCFWVRLFICQIRGKHCIRCPYRGINCMKTSNILKFGRTRSQA